MASVIAVCTSKKKGVRKEPISKGVFEENYGLVDDAHAEPEIKRQVSLLAVESVGKMQHLGLNLSHGDFAENLTTEGIDLVSLPIGTRLSVGTEVILEVSQIGKECHAACAIRRQVGECIMPTEGVFARVIQGGSVKAGDVIKTGEAQ